MTPYFGLFLSAFFAATVLPLSSEAVLAGLQSAGDHEPLVLLGVASLGNTAGSTVNWLLGRFCLHWQDRRWFPVKKPGLDRASAWFRRYGTASLLLSWLPVVGDPLTFFAGVLKVPFPTFLLLVALAKTGRYAAVMAGVDWLLGAA